MIDSGEHLRIGLIVGRYNAVVRQRRRELRMARWKALGEDMFIIMGCVVVALLWVL